MMYWGLPQESTPAWFTNWQDQSITNAFSDPSNQLNISPTAYQDPIFNMANWGGPATTLGGKITEGWNGLTNGVSNTLSSIGSSKPVQTFLNMPGTDQLNALAGAATALNGIWNGFQQNKMAKKQFNFQKDIFNQQWGAAKQQYNTQLEDRQRARVASNPNAYESVSSYMNKYGLK
ncbi:hypothetical protein [Acinetobacter baumannii]|nr:hypothetical protein [Acinetobacter baumannii]MCZ3125901.1 hypothetical protein [Acinetobacter baumannii]MDC4761776.1 hypothetical protein [Acinetobacter baumannii]MDC5355713.1 hypothetical protein [Acinetobacter baumannii]MDO7434389.1 hypothetical protein [Acinetobacter baumannii]MDW2811472.1 hypothetical protein [Acinetobacter baumannii]